MLVKIQPLKDFNNTSSLCDSKWLAINPNFQFINESDKSKYISLHELNIKVVEIFQMDTSKNKILWLPRI